MRHIIFRSIVFCLLAVGAAGCYDCEEVYIETRYRPVYMPYSELRSSNAIASEAPRALQNTGKIYRKGNYIYVNERYEGIHVIDNSDPENPQNVSFISIQGNTDIAIRGETLYANHAVDLVAVDIRNPMNVNLIGRNENAFPYQLPVESTEVADEASYDTPDPDKGIVIGYEAYQFEETRACE